MRVLKNGGSAVFQSVGNVGAVALPVAWGIVAAPCQAALEYRRTGGFGIDQEMTHSWYEFKQLPPPQPLDGTREESSALDDSSRTSWPVYHHLRNDAQLQRFGPDDTDWFYNRGYKSVAEYASQTMYTVSRGRVGISPYSFEFAKEITVGPKDTFYIVGDVLGRRSERIRDSRGELMRECADHPHPEMVRVQRHVDPVRRLGLPISSTRGTTSAAIKRLELGGPPPNDWPECALPRSPCIVPLCFLEPKIEKNWIIEEMDLNWLGRSREQIFDAQQGGTISSVGGTNPSPHSSAARPRRGRGASSSSIQQVCQAEVAVAAPAGRPVNNSRSGSASSRNARAHPPNGGLRTGRSQSSFPPTADRRSPARGSRPRGNRKTKTTPERNPQGAGAAQTVVSSMDDFSYVRITRFSRSGPAPGRGTLDTTTVNPPPAADTDTFLNKLSGPENTRLVRKEPSLDGAVPSEIEPVRGAWSRARDAGSMAARTGGFTLAETWSTPLQTAMAVTAQDTADLKNLQDNRANLHIYEKSVKVGLFQGVV